MRERFLIWLAWKMPRGLVKWCTIRCFAHASTGMFAEHESPSITITQCMQAW